MLPLLVLQQAIAVGLGVALGTLNVYFRDTAQAMNVALQFWFWLTPIVYPADILPPIAIWLLAEPMYGLSIATAR
jgi:lipopolysaccharide transport system permease protein